MENPRGRESKENLVDFPTKLRLSETRGEVK